MSLGLRTPPTVRAINVVGGLASRVGLRPSLSRADLLQAARAGTGLDDFGPPDFLEGLGTLLADLDGPANLTTIGRVAARTRILALLETRLRLIHAQRTNPAVDAQRIERPIFVLGLPRTGTTVLYGLLASNPAMRSPVSWEVARPFPAPVAANRFDDVRINQADREFDQFRKVAPGVDRIHPIGAMLPQECLAMHAPAFTSYEFPSTFPVMEYWAWLQQADMTAAYRFQHLFMRHLQTGYGGEHWILKTPAHLFWLDTLLDVFPDALVVQTHRDPATVLASVSSLMYALRSSVGASVDPHQVGREQLETWDWGLERTLAARDRLPDDRVVDVHFRETLADPVGVVRRVYERFGIEVDDAIERGVRNYLADNPRTKHGVHQYSLEDFGLDRGEADERFAPYRERFGITEVTA